MTTPAETKHTKSKRKTRSEALMGNKNAIGNSGRPRVLDPKIEAEALLEWLKKPENIVLLDFNTSRGYSRQRFSEWEKECSEFADAYCLAKETIANRREQLALESAIEKSVFHRYQAMYDKHLHAFERIEKEFDARLKAKVEAEITAKPEETARHEQVMEQLKALQNAHKSPERNSEDININTDNKSA